MGASSVSVQHLAAVRQKHRGRSWLDGLKMVGRLTLVVGLGATLALISLPATVRLVGTLAGLVWLAGAAFVLFFFRDANPQPPEEPGAILSPAHGTIDYIDTTTETGFLNGPARRISIYLSLFNVHVQHAPASGNVELLQHFPG